MTLLLIIIFAVYLLVLIFQFGCLKYRQIRPYPTLSKAKELPNAEKLPYISIIICAKNEADNLRQNLPVILSQDYPHNHFEVLVVNDASTDKTAEILSKFKQGHDNLNVITMSPKTNRLFPGKKQALHQGIQAAKNEIILLTDADCRPKSRHWVKEMTMVMCYQNKSIVLGFGAYQQRAGFLNKIICWETLNTCIQYSGMALAGRAYMGVGRNLMYQKKLYQQAIKSPDFRKKYGALPSGDDDLLLSEILTKNNAGLCLDKKAHTISKPETSWQGWWQQKSRHVSTGKLYQRPIKIILGLSALTQGLFWLLWIILVILGIISWLCPPNTLESIFFVAGIILGLIRIMYYWQNARKWYHLLGYRKFIFFYPFGEICYGVLQLLLSQYILWRNKNQWN